MCRKKCIEEETEKYSSVIRVLISVEFDSTLHTAIEQLLAASRSGGGSARLVAATQLQSTCLPRMCGIVSHSPNHTHHPHTNHRQSFHASRRERKRCTRFGARALSAHKYTPQHNRNQSPPPKCVSSTGMPTAAAGRGQQAASPTNALPPPQAPRAPLRKSGNPSTSRSCTHTPQGAACFVIMRTGGTNNAATSTGEGCSSGDTSCACSVCVSWQKQEPAATSALRGRDCTAQPKGTKRWSSKHASKPREACCHSCLLQHCRLNTADARFTSLCALQGPHHPSSPLAPAPSFHPLTCPIYHRATNHKYCCPMQSLMIFLNAETLPAQACRARDAWHKVWL